MNMAAPNSGEVGLIYSPPHLSRLVLGAFSPPGPSADLGGYSPMAV